MMSLVNISLSHIIVSDNFFKLFLSNQPHFANFHQLGCFMRQSLTACSKVHKIEKKTLKLLHTFLCIIGALSAFQSLNKQETISTRRGNML